MLATIDRMGYTLNNKYRRTVQLRVGGEGWMNWLECNPGIFHLHVVPLTSTFLYLRTKNTFLIYTHHYMFLFLAESRKRNMH